MNFLRILLHAYLYLPYGFRRMTGTGPFGSYRAKTITQPPPEDANPLKRALWQTHVKQFHDAACSVATVVNVINAMRDLRSPGLPSVSQTDILSEIRTANWKERMSDTGHRGRRGLPLAVLSAVVQASLHTYRLPYAAIETIRATKSRREAGQVRSLLWQRLRLFETKGACLVVAHFDQGAFVPTLNIPHISPVGGFDPVTGDVTILDVDPEQPQPYAIPFDIFYKGIASNYHNVFRYFGYGSGGCVVIRLL